MEKEAKTRRRKIHVDLPEQMHQKLRVKAALEDVSMQAFVTRIVDEAVKDVVVPKFSSRKKQP
jgi:predicted HicB family RNase H-like nuclease